MNALLLRTTLLLIHAVANFIIVSTLVNYDLTDSWLHFAGFIIILLILTFIFVKHLLSYIYFIKTKTK